ncbi:hypothetical protein O3P69_008421 [Scylla paramamosain]|uniref:STAS domain-containing protein n=1 Tax=Scylla paramamosain TaxID=85552 RepID=A0AAW0SLK9_SCYPA
MLPSPHANQTALHCTPTPTNRYSNAVRIYVLLLLLLLLLLLSWLCQQPVMDPMSANSCEVQVTRPALTLHRRIQLYNSCLEEQADVRERTCGWSLKCNRFSRGRVWEIMAARLPILDWLPKYQPRQAFLGDLIAGLTVGVMAVPQGMAYAMLAHLPPITGLYAGVISGLVYMLLGTSHHISFGVVGSLGVLTAKAIGNVVTYETVPGSAAAPLSTTLSTTATLAQGLQNFTADGNSTSDHSGYSSVEMVVVLALLTGLWQMLMGVLQLGQVFSVLLSHMIVSAFTTSVAYDILFSQLKSLLGIPLPRYTGAFKSFYTCRDLSLALLTANPTVVGVSALCITLLVANNEILKPRLKKVCPVPVPVELVVMVVGTVVSHVLNLEEEQNVTVIGHVPKGFPTPSVPHLELVPQLLAHSFIIAIIAKRKGYVIQATQELFAHGITNFVGSFFSCAPVSVSLSRSVIQEEVGGVTGLASLFSCSVLMIMLYSIGPLFSALPNCVLSAVILVSFKGLFLQVKDLAKLWSSSRLDAAIWLATFVVSVVVGLDYGLLAGLAASAVVLLLRSQRPPALHLGHVPFTDLYLDLNTYHKAVKVPGVKIFQFGGPLHFGNASYFHSSLFSVTGLDLAAAKPAATTTVPLMDTRQSEVDKEALFAVTVNSELNHPATVTCSNAGVGRWCIRHSCAGQDDFSSFYDTGSDETHESGASQASTSHTDVSQDDTSHSDTENDDTGSDVRVHCDLDQDNTSQERVSRVSTQDTASDSLSIHKPTDVTLINMEDEAAKDFTCFSFQVCRWLVLDLSLVSFVDTTGASLLKQLHRDLQTAGVTLCLASASDRVVDALERCSVLEEISRDLVFHSIHDAVTTITCPRHSPTTLPDFQ